MLVCEFLFPALGRTIFWQILMFDPPDHCFADVVAGFLSGSRGLASAADGPLRSRGMKWGDAQRMSAISCFVAIHY